MKSLLINTSTRKITVSIVVDNEIQYLYNEYNVEDLAKSLIPIIAEALQKVNMKPNEIDTIFVANGPGSFTGIRIGVTVAKIMAWSLNIKVVPISSLELMATTRNNKEYIAPLIDARRGYVYAGLYDNKLNSIIADAYVSLDDFKKQIGDKDVLYISYEKFGFEGNEPNYDILKIINKHKDDEGINPHKLNPNYLKRAEAEEKLNESRC